MIEIDPFFEKGFRWNIFENIAIKGYVYTKDNKYLHGSALKDYLESEIDSSESFVNCISNLSGCFSIIYNIGSDVFLAVDITRTFPIFYVLIENRFIISNSAENLARYTKYEIDKENIFEFKYTGYVTGNKTLFKNIFQVEPGSVVIWENNEIAIKQYFTYATDTYFRYSFNILSEKLEIILDGIANRLIESLNGHTAVVPLSGGYDSRLVASLLKKKNYNNVICFTYGRKDSFEVDISRKVAQSLSFRWVFIEYTEELISRAIQSNKWLKYLQFGFNYVSVSCIQDFFAVYEMHAKNLIPEDSIIIPGHSGDFYAGTHTLGFSNKNLNFNRIIAGIIGHHYSLEPRDNKFNIIPNIDNKSDMFAHSIIENWDIKNRQAKFIVNANRVYEFFGYEHRVPLWDKSIAEFFKYVDIKYKNRDKIHFYREKDNLYDSVAMKIFRIYKLDVYKTNCQGSYASYFFQKIKSKIAKALPIKLKKLTKIIIKKLKLNYLKQNVSFSDPDNFIGVAHCLGYDLFKYANINSIIIEELKKRIIKDYVNEK